jgi:hypothetical protein
LATRVPARLTAGEGRRFGLTLGAAFVALGGLLWWRGRAAAPVAAVLGILLVAAGLGMPTRLAPLERAWMGLAETLSKITTPVFFGGVYFGAIAPAGLLLRLAGRNAVARPRRQRSTWIAREEGTRRRRDMEHLF